jgi:transcriptional regulator with XRE-family HTH domain
MTQLANKSLKEDSTKLSEDQGPESTNLISRKGLIRRLKRGPDARTRFVESHINKTLAFQIRSLRGDLSQERAVEKLGMNQNAISRLENPYYGKATLTTLKRIASAYDVGLLVEFVPFSRLANRVSGTPQMDYGLSPDTMNLPSFEEELQQDIFESNRNITAAPSSLFRRYQEAAVVTGTYAFPQHGTQIVDTGAAVSVIVPPTSGAIQPEMLQAAPSSPYTEASSLFTAPKIRVVRSDTRTRVKGRWPHSMSHSRRSGRKIYFARKKSA